MWHLRTRQGTFWVIEDASTKSYHLGVDDDKLAVYADPESAVADVSKQSTGFPAWDSLTRVKVPEQLTSWAEGEPEHWNE